MNKKFDKCKINFVDSYTTRNNIIKELQTYIAKNDLLIYNLRNFKTLSFMANKMDVLPPVVSLFALVEFIQAGGFTKQQLENAIKTLQTMIDFYKQESAKLSLEIPSGIEQVLDSFESICEVCLKTDNSPPELRAVHFNTLSSTALVLQQALFFWQNALIEKIQKDTMEKIALAEAEIRKIQLELSTKNLVIDEQ